LIHSEIQKVFVAIADVIVIQVDIMQRYITRPYLKFLILLTNI